uniref:glucuronosyltransferase n=1 Tax=Strongyloides papillosus TaxID=174720 RepID=A0A0N5B9C5_STREA
MILLKSLLIFCFFLHSYNAYKILIFNPKFGHSHVNFFGQIADILADAGHNVTVIAADMNPLIKHPGTKKANIYHIPGDPIVANLLTNKTKLGQIWETSSSVFEQFDIFNDFMKAQKLSALNIFHNEELANFVKRQKFDLAITEVMNYFMYGLFKAWGIPATISGSPVGLMEYNYEMFGLHFPASHIPTMMQPSHDKMTYYERFQNFFNYHISKLMMHTIKREFFLEDEFKKKYGEDFYDPFKLIGDSSFILLNSNPFFDNPGPKTPKMVEISGIGIPESQPLDEYWSKILSLRKYTVLISFGSVARSSEMPVTMKKGIIETVKNLPHITFIWKYETPEDGSVDKLDNLILSKWIPQNDLLNDPRLSLFITHGGANSIAELSYKGVPAIAVPIFGDQFRNAKLVEKHNIGLVINKQLLKSSDQLTSNINKIISEPQYKKNSFLVSQRLKKRPIGPKELLIKHVEFACEFGQLPVLDLASRDMSTIEYFNLDIIIPILLLLVLISYLVVIMTIKLVKFSLFKTDKKQKLKTN